MFGFVMRTLANMAKSPGDIEHKPLKRFILSSRRLSVLVLGKFLRGYSPIEPLALQIETTTNCNLKCIHCERTYWPVQKYKDMTFEEFKKIIDPLKNVKSISLTGIGEPLLNRDLLKMASYAKSKGMRVEFTTNATMINERTGPAIIEAGVDLLCFSMESARPEEFERIRVGANFGRVVNNIKEFVALRSKMGSKTPEVELRTVAMIETVDEIPGLMRLAKEMGIKFVKVNSLIYEFKGDLHSPEGQHSVEVYEQCQKLAADIGVELDWTMIGGTKFTPGSCIIPYHTPYIFRDGRVAPCCLATQRNSRDDIVKKYTFGNAINTPLGQMVNNRDFVRFRRQLLSTKFEETPKLCQDCFMLHRD